MLFTSFVPHSETVLQKQVFFLFTVRHHFLADVTYRLINDVMFYEGCLLVIKLYIHHSIYMYVYSETYVELIDFARNFECLFFSTSVFIVHDLISWHTSSHSAFFYLKSASESDWSFHHFLYSPTDNDRAHCSWNWKVFLILGLKIQEIVGCTLWSVH